MSKYNVAFSLKTDSVWKIPGQCEETPIKLWLEIKNLDKQSLKFPIMDKIDVMLVTPEGDEIKKEGGQDVLIPGKPVSDPVQPNEILNITLKAHLCRNELQQLQLRLEDDYGSVWYIGPLNKEAYFLKIVYQNEPHENTGTGIWFGSSKIPQVRISIE